MKRFWPFAIAAMALLGAAPVAQIQSILAKPKTLCGRFEQSKQLVGLKKPVASNGRFCVVADKGVLWRTLQPFPNTLKLTRDEIVQLVKNSFAVAWIGDELRSTYLARVDEYLQRAA